MCCLGLYSQPKNDKPFIAKVWTDTGDHTADMVAGIAKFLEKETGNALKNRGKYWHPDFANEMRFNESIAVQRNALQSRLGVVDKRCQPDLQVESASYIQPFLLDFDRYTVQAVNWAVLGDLRAEGLLLTPKSEVKGLTIVLPDADMLPEHLLGMNGAEVQSHQLVLDMVQAGMMVLIPTLVDRNQTYSGNSRLNAWTTQSHREWLYRQGYELGRHVIGYELQKIFAGIDWFNTAVKGDLPIGLAGYGEGGLLALYASAIDTRITSTLVSGYFADRQQLWKEPIYRNVFDLLKNFGDAELALMVWPRQLVIEHASGPRVDGTPVVHGNRPKGSPGNIDPISYASSKAEWDRAKSLRPKNDSSLHWKSTDDDPKNSSSPFFGSAAIIPFMEGLGLAYVPQKHIPLSSFFMQTWLDIEKRQERTVRGIEREIQKELDWCEQTRNANFWHKLTGDTVAQRQVKEKFRGDFWEQLGSLPVPTLPFNTHARLLQRTDKWTSYAVKLDVWEDVYTWGILLIPHHMKVGERRPVVVCQHGLEGLPQDVINTDPTGKTFHFYKGFGSTLADKGYIVFAPANLYRGEDKFRVLQRQANPIGLSLFSIIIGQHQRITQWLKSLDFVRAHQIGFYGLSYGGKTAMRVPAVVKDYCLSICSGDFNEWVRKCSSTTHIFSYMYTEEYDMQEWDLGHTFNYAEMAALIAPRPFMVERGHLDGVAVDEWVGYEYEKVRRHYAKLAIPESTAIEYFMGPHTIHGKGTFDFLDKYLPL